MADLSAIQTHEGNVTRSVPPPFFAVPSWWRRFLFWTLSPREVTVYLYVLSLLDRNGVAFPTQAQMAYELGLSTSDVVALSIKKLEKLGFLLRARMQLPESKTASERTIYQRPAVEFTLLRLLKLNKIDGRLYPVKKDVEQFHNELDTTASAVELGLRNVIGPSRYAEYATGRMTSDALKSALLASLAHRMNKNEATIEFLVV